MVEISDRDSQRRDVLSQLLQQSRNHAFYKKNEQQPYTPKGREIHDTVEISSGSKIVNLGRGFDLANDIRADKDPDTLKERLKQGASDIRRIGRLFRAVFSAMRFGFGRYF